mgnify:CR=1 FL=1
MSYKGPFRPKNPQKYIGNPTNIIYRSLWELRLMRYFDMSSSVLQWGSEEIIIPYISPIDNRIHRYFPDFIVKMRGIDGTINTSIIEVKPYAQTKEPMIQEKRTRKYLKEVYTWGINQAKWKAAIKYCADRKWDFKIMTEKDIGV